MRIGVIGTGTIAAAVVRGIAGHGHQIMVSDRGARHAQALRADFANVTVANNQAVIDQSDVILLGLMAEAAAQVLPLLSFRAGQRVVSMMAGATLAQVAAMVAPAEAAVIMVPFPGIAQGGSPVIAQGDVALVADLVGPANTVYPVRSQAELSAYLSAQAVLSPVARLVSDAADWLGPHTTDPEGAEAFLRQLVSSSLANARADALVAALNTPGGYNQRLRQRMEAAGLRSALQEGLEDLNRG